MTTLNDQSHAMVRAPSDEAFGKYTLIAKIGHGGMAEVFLAANRGPAGFTKLTVLKRLHPHLEEEDGLVGMFLDEARLAARLNHPHVVQTYEIGHAEGLHYLAMEYLEGQSLARLLRHARKVEEPLPLSVGVKMFIDVLDGLHYAHSLRDFDGSPLNVVHRDISPGNLFITYEGQVKILDFGIAKAGTQLNETRAGQVKGKFAYIAPEQAAPGVHDHRADLWSLGVVMWEAFAGRRLFKGDSEVLTLHNTLTSQIVSLDETGIPAPLAAIVDRSLQRDPMARYQSAREMKEDLENYMHDAGLRASRSDIGAMVTGLFERERDEQRRVLKAYMAGELAGEALAPVHTSTGSHSGVVDRDESLLPPVQSGEIHEPRRSMRWVLILILLFSAALGGLLAALFSGDIQDATQVATNDPDPEPDPGVMDFGGDPVTDEGGEPGEGDEGAAEERGEGTGGEGATQDVDDEGPNARDETEEDESSMGAPGQEDEVPTAMAEGRTGRTRRAHMGRRIRPTMMTATMEPVMEEAVVAPSEDTGFLTLDTVPWSQVSLNGESLGTTPILRHRLPAGAHTLVLVNPERGLRQRYRVTIRPGETTRRRVGLD